MAHIQLSEELPGIVGPLNFSPDTAKPLLELAEVLLRGPNTLTSAEREMIATYVSSQNDCKFCQFSHGAAAAEHLGGDYDLIDRLKLDYETAEVSDKMKALLAVAGKVQKGGKQVTSDDIARARRGGATDKEILTPCSSPQPFACTTATWMVWRPRSPPIGIRIARWGKEWPRKDTSVPGILRWKRPEPF
jgi:uncharacterized peroxidase-related enzyme